MRRSVPHFRQLRRIQPRNYISIGHAAISVRIVPLFIVASEHGGARKEGNECFQSVHRHSQLGADQPSVFLSFHSPVDEPIIEAVQAVRKLSPLGPICTRPVHVYSRVWTHIYIRYIVLERGVYRLGARRGEKGGQRSEDLKDRNDIPPASGLIKTFVLQLLINDRN